MSDDGLPEGVASPWPATELTCSACGASSLIGVPDDGLSMVWECPQCDARNQTDGVDPAARAVTEAALAHARAQLESEFHADGDEGSSTQSVS